MKVKVISLPYIFKVLYVLCFTGPRYQVGVYRTNLQDHWSSGFQVFPSNRLAEEGNMQSDLKSATQYNFGISVTFCDFPCILYGDRVTFSSIKAFQMQ